MSHERLREMLDDYASGTLTLPEREEVRAHLEGCGECRAEAEALRELLADAAALPHDVAPPRDLWQGIAARLEPRGSLAGGGETVQAVERPGAPALLLVAPPADLPAETGTENDDGGAQVLPFRRKTVQVPRWLLAAAAVTVMALSSGVTALLLRGPAGGGGIVGGGDVALPSGTAATPTALVAFAQGERSYRSAIDELETLLRAKREHMAPETVATLERNLAIIDAAIRDSRRALENDPNNQELAQMLSSVYETKVSTLQRAVEL